ncbi:glycerophosphocholine phosphodiesterase GPCPD1 isoform X2 [Bacillus rossius redtenbacheri]|uniref:glycerophosphocholine phosphodiesterase GPCPD1 isoform X2 n=1 Tax=Bacillus rossius redtenbacheri TaxID=93214 RepID=UPI002FDD13C4
MLRRQEGVNGAPAWCDAWQEEMATMGEARPGRDRPEDDSRQWRFRVRAETLPGENVCVVGDCRALGDWSSRHMLHLSLENDVWSGVASIPRDRDVEFRYAVCVVLSPDCINVPETNVIVRHWETHIVRRKIPCKAGSNVEAAGHCKPDVYGQHDGTVKVDQGWLTTNTVIQLKFFNNPLVLWKRKLQGRKIYIKLSPVNLARQQSLEPISSTDNMEESMDTHDGPEEPEMWPIAEIAVMNEEERMFRLQEQFGRPYEHGEFMIFNINVLFPETVAFLVDYYVYSSRAEEGEPPYHVGFSYLLPGVLKQSEGQVVTPVTSTRHRPIGQLTVDYMVVRPMKNFECDMSTSFARLWKESWLGLDVGHRGSGTSFKGEPKECADVMENTIASLKQAASSGADLVEFDVQLSKDLVPVLYHDFHVCIAMKRRRQLEEHDMLELPLKDLTLDQLHLLKGNWSYSGLTKGLHVCELGVCGVYHVTEKTSSRVFSNEEEDDHQPFPTLQQALEVIDPHVGFNIEIKWNMQLQDGTYEVYHPFDLNLYLDVVLKVVLEHAGPRKIVISCFHPDVCSMIRLKQNKYPVIFLTQGVTNKYPPYLDPRSQSVPMGIHFAKSAGILGINVHTEDLLRDPSQVRQVREAGLVIFCWGDDNNNVETIQHLKSLGLHGIIYDKIDQFSRKEVKESIFLVEAREAQRELLKVAESPGETGPPSQQDPPMSVDAARGPLVSVSACSFLSDEPSLKPDPAAAVAAVTGS